MRKLVVLIIVGFWNINLSNAQSQFYYVGDTLEYPKPKQFAFITKFPATYAGAARIAFKKESLKNWGIIAGSTAVLLLLDQDIANKVHQASNYIGL